MKHIETKKGLQTLLRRYEEAGASEYWLKELANVLKKGLQWTKRITRIRQMN